MGVVNCPQGLGGESAGCSRDGLKMPDRDAPRWAYVKRFAGIHSILLLLLHSTRVDEYIIFLFVQRE